MIFKVKLVISGKGFYKKPTKTPSTPKSNSDELTKVKSKLTQKINQVKRYQQQATRENQKKKQKVEKLSQKELKKITVNPIQ